MALWETDHITIAELLERTAIDGGAMSLILKKLEDKGFLMVTKDETDKRVKRVQLTKMGKKKNHSRRSTGANVVQTQRYECTRKPRIG